MRPYLAHPHEEERLLALRALGLLDSIPRPHYDKITATVVAKLRVPIVTISVLDEEREWFISKQGTKLTELPREHACCSWALVSEGVFMVEDALKDKRFSDNYFVVHAPRLRFYAGVAMYDAHTNLPVAVLSALDIVPRRFSDGEMDVFLDLASEVERLINERTHLFTVEA